MSAFGGIIALFFGAIFFLPHLDDMPGPAKLFFAVWFLVVIGGIIYSLINAAGRCRQAKWWSLKSTRARSRLGRRRSVWRNFRS